MSRRNNNDLLAAGIVSGIAIVAGAGVALYQFIKSRRQQEATRQEFRNDTRTFSGYRSTNPYGTDCDQNTTRHRIHNANEARENIANINENFINTSENNFASTNENRDTNIIESSEVNSIESSEVNTIENCEVNTIENCEVNTIENCEVNTIENSEVNTTENDINNSAESSTSEDSDAVILGDCIICKKDLSEESVFKLDCNHYFHKLCILSNYVLHESAGNFKCPILACSHPVSQKTLYRMTVS